MKRVIIAIVLVVTLGTTNSVKAWTWGAGAADLGAAVPTGWPNFWGSPQKPSMPKHYVEIINLIKQQLKLHKEHIEKTKETYDSITGKGKLNIEKVNYSSFFLKDPKSIYNKEKRSEISASLTDMQQKESLIGSVSDMRKSIEKRILYTTAINRDVSLKAFENTEARLNHILVLLNKIDEANDLKSIAELQARIKGMLAMIQNETTKLQMIAHSRNTEQELIKQQKQKRNLKILSSENKTMPTIRPIR
ncbi:type IV secretion system protein [Bartonella sp. B39]